MIIEQIKIRNYRQYRKMDLNFSPFQKEKNFVLRDESKALPIVNTVALKSLETGKSTDAKVEIHFTNDAGEKMIVERSLKFIKTNNGYRILKDSQTNSKDGSSLTFMKVIRNDTKPQPNPELLINNKFPQSIEEYFFFDGEKLEQYFKKHRKENIKLAVKKISQINLLEKFIEHIKDVRKKYEKEASKLKPDVINIEDELKTLRGSKKDLESEKTHLESEKIEAEEKIKKYSDLLKGVPEGNIEQLENKRVKLEEAIEKSDNRLDKLNVKKIKFLVNSLPIVYSYQEMNTVLNEINKTEDAGKIPGEYQRAFIERLLRESECICGNDLSKDTKACECLNKILEIDDEMQKTLMMKEKK